MVPGSWPSVLLFVVLVAPGLLFDLLSERRRGGFPESTFREISRVVLASFVFSSAAFAVLVVTRTFKPAWMPDPRSLIQDGTAYLPDHYRLVLRALVLQAGLALGAVGLIHWRLAKKRGGTPIQKVSAWTQVFRNDCPAGFKPYIRVKLTSGTVYTGYVLHAAPDLDADGRELVLGSPLWYRGDDKNLAPVHPDYHCVVVRGTDIETMLVQYRPDPTKSDQP